ncbi:hypothetical protein HOG98_06950 [bacterium]|jgi:hypothetical protein|nr:hypothetical protein [bacterium]
MDALVLKTDLDFKGPPLKESSEPTFNTRSKISDRSQPFSPSNPSLANRSPFSPKLSWGGTSRYAHSLTTLDDYSENKENQPDTKQNGQLHIEPFHMQNEGCIFSCTPPKPSAEKVLRDSYSVKNATNNIPIIDKLSPNFGTDKTSSEIENTVRKAVSEFKFDYNGFSPLLSILKRLDEEMPATSSDLQLKTIRGAFSNFERDFAYKNADNCSGLSATVGTLFEDDPTIKANVIFERIVIDKNTLANPAHSAAAILCSDNVCLFIDVMEPDQVVKLPFNEPVTVKNRGVDLSENNCTTLTLKYSTRNSDFYIQKVVRAQRTKAGQLEEPTTVTSNFPLKKYTNTTELVDSIYINKDGSPKYVYSILGYERPEPVIATQKSNGKKLKAPTSTADTRRTTGPISPLELKGTAGIIFDATNMTLRFKSDPLNSKRTVQKVCSLDDFEQLESTESQLNYKLIIEEKECILTFDQQPDGDFILSKLDAESSSVKAIFKPAFFSTLQLNKKVLFDQILEIKNKKHLITQFMDGLATMKSNHMEKISATKQNSIPMTLVPINTPQDIFGSPLPKQKTFESLGLSPAKKLCDKPASIKQVDGKRPSTFTSPTAAGDRNAKTKKSMDRLLGMVSKSREFNILIQEVNPDNS